MRDTTRNLLVFDVESDGLYGKAFSIGAAVLDRWGKVLDTFTGFVYGTKLTDPWTIKEFGEEPKAFNKFNLYRSLEMMYYDFYMFYRKWNESSDLVTDCMFPVETNFLKGMYKSMVSILKTDLDSPYPVLDISSMLYGMGIDPDHKRIELSHLTGVEEHNPLHDAINSGIAFIFSNEYHTPHENIIYVADENIINLITSGKPYITFITKDEFEEKKNNEPDFRII